MRPPYIPPPTKTTLRTPARSRDRLSMDPVEVFCRIRPILSSTPVPRDTEPTGTELCIKALDTRTVQLTPPSGSTSASNFVKAQKCTFTYVFDELAPQKDVFDRVSFDLVSDLIQGKNGLLFTYGVTGSGKTYTMTGNPKEIGILPRALDTLFNSIGNLQASKNVFKIDTKTNTFNMQSEAEAMLETQRDNLRPPQSELRSGRKSPTTPGVVWDGFDWEMCPRAKETERVRCVDDDNSYAVFVSYIQIYNNYVYDLLDTQTAMQPDKLPPSKLLREDMDRNMFVSGVTELEVKNTEEAFDVFMRGQRLRRTATTLLNTESSRSHSVFNIRLLQAPLDSNGREVIQDRRKIHVSQLSLVDLAGSERSNRTGNIGDRMRETGNINESLMTLRQCIEQLRENQKTGANKLVPYRNSRLTHLFKNYFDGEGKVRMIVCVNPSASDYDENKHVMDFAELTQEVEVARANGFGFQEGPDGIMLTPGRRRAAALYEEVRERIERDLANEGCGISNLPKPPTFSLFFEPMPSINLQGMTPNDDNWILQLRNHFEAQYKRRRELMAETAQKNSEFEAALRKFVIDHEALKLRYQQEAKEFSEREQDNHRLQVELRGLQSRNAILEAKLAKYERDAKYMQSQEDQLKKREREMAAQVRQKDEKLRAVKEIFERAPLVSIQGQTPRKTNPDNGSTATTTGLSSRLAGNKTLLYPQLPVYTSAPLRSAAAGAMERRRAPSPPPKPYRVPNTPMGTRTLNRVAATKGGRGRTHRRSKSVDATVHEAGGLTTLKSAEEDTSDNSGGQKRKSDEVDDGQGGSSDGQFAGNVKKSKF